MKKIICVGIICLIALLTLSGCGNEPQNNNTTNVTENVTNNTGVENTLDTNISQEILTEENKIIQKQTQDDGGEIRIEYIFNSENKLEKMIATYEAKTAEVAEAYYQMIQEESEGLYENIVKTENTITADATSDVIEMYQYFDKETLLNFLQQENNS